MKEMDYKKMVEDIDKLVNNDWGFTMIDEHQSTKAPFTQTEACQMSEVLGNIYRISHGISCRACGFKYKLTNQNEKD